MGGEYRITDALEGLKSLSAGSVNLVVTDPAYNTLEKWRSKGTTTRLSHSKSSSNDWFPVVDFAYLGECVAECYRVLRNHSYLFVMCDFFTGVEVHTAAIAAGFEAKKPLIWEKVGKKLPVRCPNCRTQVAEIQGRGSPGMGYPFRSGYEMIYFAQKGKRKPPEDKSVRDVLRFQRPRGKNLWPTQKPIPLLETLIRLSSSEGELVLDPFAGSGATLLAANQLGRDYLGFDINSEGLAYFHTQLGVESPALTTEKKKTRMSSPIFNMFSGKRGPSGQ